MYQSTPPNALTLFRAEQCGLRTFLSGARNPAGSQAADNDAALHRLLPELRSRLSRYCRLEEDFLHVPLSNPQPPQAVRDARVRCESLHQMIERVAALHGQDDKKADYRAAVAALIEQALQHVDVTESTLFPLVVESGVDLTALGEQMLEVPPELPPDEAPAATRVPDGRLDIGSGEGHNPPPQGETPPDAASH